MSTRLAPPAHPVVSGARVFASRPPSSFQCLVVVASVRAALLVLGFERTYRTVAWLTRKGAPGASGPTEFVAATAHKVAFAAAFFPGRARCLEQSLALFGFLRRADLAVTFRLGVQAYPFAAHAWVEHAGEPVNENRELLQAYVPLPDATQGIR